MLLAITRLPAAYSASLSDFEPSCALRFFLPSFLARAAFATVLTLFERSFRRELRGAEVNLLRRMQRLGTLQGHAPSPNDRNDLGG